MLKDYKTKVFLIYLFLFSFSFCSTSWNYNKGGLNWPSTCQGDNQAPLDIHEPFTHKSKQFFIK